MLAEVVVISSSRGAPPSSMGPPPPAPDVPPTGLHCRVTGALCPCAEACPSMRSPACPATLTLAPPRLRMRSSTPCALAADSTRSARLSRCPPLACPPMTLPPLGVVPPCPAARQKSIASRTYSPTWATQPGAAGCPLGGAAPMACGCRCVGGLSQRNARSSSAPRHTMGSATGDDHCWPGASRGRRRHTLSLSLSPPPPTPLVGHHSSRFHIGGSVCGELLVTRAAMSTPRRHLGSGMWSSRRPASTSIFSPPPVRSSLRMAMEGARSASWASQCRM
mmetsp:Transcript_13449/g.34506  ORF Transcript_13449/g.34506 Transcript_13449/m.34506 type:complete len:278 (+) Transcript_13449:500-1333(+)